MELKPAVSCFDTLKSGEEVMEVTLRNDVIACKVITFGATLRSLYVPDKTGKLVDVVLGYDTVEEYLTNDGYLGATVGRVANRTAKGRFTLNGKEYLLACNDGNNHLHGGNVGFSHRLWDIAEVQEDSVMLTYHSADGEEGYPANLDVSVTYRLKGTGLHLHYQAKADGDTVCSLTNHSYFNLGGHDSGNVLKQKMTIYAENYTPSDAESIPVGTREPVAGTPMDFRVATPIGARIDEDFWQLKQAKGYDHNYAVNPNIGTMQAVAEVVCEESGIAMTVSTTMPGMHFYSGNYMNDGRVGKGGCRYGLRHGFCLETQHFPDAINQPAFPSAALKAGEQYDHSTSFMFGIAE